LECGRVLFRSLRAHDAEALAPRGNDHDRSLPVALLQLRARDEAERVGEQGSQRPGAGYEQVDTLARGRQVLDALLAREAARVEDLRRVGLLADRLGGTDSPSDGARGSGFR